MRSCLSTLNDPAQRTRNHYGACTMSKTIDLIKEHEVKWVDLRFTDSRGKEQHVTLPATEVDEDFFADGKMFDGSSISGWKGINESDMILMPVDETSVLDPFTEETTVNITCNIVEPTTMQGYERDPRSVAQRAEEYLKSTGIADGALLDRKSTRLNSSHVRISYAVFCLKKKQQ